jgi:hydrogenase expression/formation protein HypC
MCITIPGQIVEIVDPIHRLALVALAGQQRLVNLSPLTLHGGAVGEWVIVQAGLAVGRLSEEEAQSTLVLLHELEQLYDEAS